MTLQFGIEIRQEAMLVDVNPEEIVPFGAVAACTADEGMVPVDINDIVAQWAVVLGGEERDASATAQHDKK